MRDCFRLAAIIRGKGSADTLDTGELLRLGDWCCEPPGEESAQLWAEEFAVPLIRELAARLGRQRDSQDVDLPRLLEQIKAMRDAQRACSARRLGKERATLTAHREQQEKAVDEIVSNHLQPRLFDMSVV